MGDIRSSGTLRSVSSLVSWWSRSWSRSWSLRSSSLLSSLLLFLLVLTQLDVLEAGDGVRHRVARRLDRDVLVRVEVDARVLAREQGVRVGLDAVIRLEGVLLAARGEKGSGNGERERCESFRGVWACVVPGPAVPPHHSLRTQGGPRIGRRGRREGRGEGSGERAKEKTRRAGRARGPFRVEEALTRTRRLPPARSRPALARPGGGGRQLDKLGRVVRRAEGGRAGRAGGIHARRPPALSRARSFARALLLDGSTAPPWATAAPPAGTARAA